MNKGQNIYNPLPTYQHCGRECTYIEIVYNGLTNVKFYLYQSFNFIGIRK